MLTLRRLVTLHLPTARRQILTCNVPGTLVLWLDVQRSPCALSLLPSITARHRLNDKLAAAKVNDMVLTRQIAAALALLTAFEVASQGHVGIPAFMCGPLSVVCMPDGTERQALRLEATRFGEMSDAERSAHLAALEGE